MHECAFAVNYFSVSVLISPVIMRSRNQNIKEENSQVKNKNPEQCQINNKTRNNQGKKNFTSCKQNDYVIVNE